MGSEELASSYHNKECTLSSTVTCPRCMCVVPYIHGGACCSTRCLCVYIYIHIHIICGFHRMQGSCACVPKVFSEACASHVQFSYAIYATCISPGIRCY